MISNIINDSNLDPFVMNLHKLFLDEVPLSKEDYRTFYGTYKGWEEYNILFPAEGSKMRATEAVANFLDHTLYRHFIKDYEINVEDHAILFNIILTTDKQIVISFGV